MKVVIDTNGLLNSIPSNSKNKWLYHAFIEDQFDWVISNEIISEYSELIALTFGKKTMEFILSSLLSSKNHIRYEPIYKWSLISQDPDDNKFIDCAIGSNADYLVSDDNHILALRKIPRLFPPVPIVTFMEFEKILE